MKWGNYFYGYRKKMASEENINKKSNEVFWRNLFVRYWYIALIFGIIIIGAIIGFILTFEWYIDTSTIGGHGSWIFNQFSLGTAIEWVIFLVLWTLLFVALPTLAAPGILLAIIWFVVLSQELKDELKIRFKTIGPGKKSSSSGGFSFLLFIGVCIYVFIDGNWLTEFGDLTYGYFMNARVTVLTWGLIIFGIPVVIIGIIWVAVKYGKSNSTSPSNEIQNKDAK